MSILDNARIHRAKIIQKFCQKQGIILVDLPPYSPTLNPIEFLWKDVKKKRSRVCRYTADLVRSVLSQSAREPIDILKQQGLLIAQDFCQSRQESYPQKWREKFLYFIKRKTIFKTSKIYGVSWYDLTFLKKCQPILQVSSLIQKE